MKSVSIFTDGACRGNPGPGGWGVVMFYNKNKKELRGFADDTTNNRMEITAAIQALSALKQPCRVVLTTDSQYLRKGITEWLPQWKQRSWRTASRKPVKNADLWVALDEATQKHDIEWRWVKAHAGHAENERADELANTAIDEHLEPLAK